MEDDVDDEWAPTAASVVGAGKQRPSWIWFNGNACEDIQDPATCAGEYSLLFKLYVILICTKHYKQSGLSPGP